MATSLSWPAPDSSELRLSLLAMQHISRFLSVRSRICCRVTCEHFGDLAEHALYNVIIRPKYSRYVLNVADDGSLKTTKAVQIKWQALILNMVETNLHALANLTGLFVRMPVFYESTEILQQLKSVLRQLCTLNAATIVTLGWIYCNVKREQITAAHHVPAFSYRDVLRVSLSLPHLSALYLPSFHAMPSLLKNNLSAHRHKNLDRNEEFDKFQALCSLWSLLEPKTTQNTGAEILPPFKNLRQLHFSDSAFKVRNLFPGKKQQHFVVAAFSGVELVTVSSLKLQDDVDVSDTTFRSLPHNLLRNLFPNPACVIIPRQLKFGITLAASSFFPRSDSDSEDDDDAVDVQHSFSELVEQACRSTSTLMEQQVILEIEASGWEYILDDFHKLERLYAEYLMKYRHIKILLRIDERCSVPWSFVAELIQLCRNIRIVYEIYDTPLHNSLLMKYNKQNEVPSVKDIPDSIANIFDTRTAQTVQPLIETLADAYNVDLVNSRFGWLHVKYQVYRDEN